jgi:hypothetical protein
MNVATKPARMLVWGIAVAAALGIGFLAGRYRAPVQSTAAGVQTASDDMAPQTASNDPAPGMARHANARSAPSAAASAATQAVQVPATAPMAGDAPAAGGPRPLLAEDMARFEGTENRIRSDRGVWADMLELSESEEQDDGAWRLEQQLALAIRRHGDSYSELRLSPPRCTRSVCVLRGIGSGDTQNPRSNWQRLNGAIMSEPWFRQSFDDMSSMVSGDGGDTVYLTMFLRCAPGTCRFGQR